MSEQKFPNKLDLAKRLMNFYTSCSAEKNEQSKLGNQVFGILSNCISESQSPEAINMMGFCYQNGIGTKQDIGLAMSYYKMAETLGNSDAKTNLRTLEENKVKTTVIPKTEKKITAEEKDKATFGSLKEEADAGNIPSLMAMAEMTLEGRGTEMDAMEAKSLYETASAFCCDEAKERIKELPKRLWDMASQAQRKGNYERAFKCFYQDTLLGYAPAMRDVGDAYRTGRGVLRDEEQARLWYELAADNGDELAVENLKKLQPTETKEEKTVPLSSIFNDPNMQRSPKKFTTDSQLSELHESVDAFCSAEKKETLTFLESFLKNWWLCYQANPAKTFSLMTDERIRIPIKPDGLMISARFGDEMQAAKGHPAVVVLSYYNCLCYVSEIRRGKFIRKREFMGQDTEFSTVLRNGLDKNDKEEALAEKIKEHNNKSLSKNITLAERVSHQFKDCFQLYSAYPDEFHKQMMLQMETTLIDNINKGGPNFCRHVASCIAPRVTDYLHRHFNGYGYNRRPLP